ncbi:MAG: hypothetical protein GHCLOJNM_03812 [bacterium]|nr:hypothetical protein [bacterium]
MDNNPFTPTRRAFLAGAAGAALALSRPSRAEEPVASAPPKRDIPLGFDNFSIRSLGWNAEQLLDYAGQVGVDVLMLSNLGVYTSFEESYLAGLKEKADRLGVQIIPGTNSICPTSGAWDPKYGSPQELLTLGLRIAKTLGAKAFRCYLGHRGDRKSEGNIYPHIEETVKVCRGVRSVALETGVKIAIENHAGDMQAWELAGLVEAAGKDFVGVTLDSGNATWTVEDPLASLEILGPLAAASGMRDSAVWEIETGAAVQWTNMGDGAVDWEVYVNRFAELCPGIPFILEIISGGPQEFHYLEPAFWDTYPRGRAADLARFVALAKRGRPAVAPPGRPSGEGPEVQKQQQLFDLEQSIRFCKEKLGLGLKA